MLEKLYRKFIPQVGGPKAIISLLWSDYPAAYAVRWGFIFVTLFVLLLVAGVGFQEYRFVIIPFLAFIYAFISAARFLQDLYELPDYGDALTYLLASSFLPGERPSVSVSAGRLNINEDKVNLIKRIGGPGFVTVAPYNVVLFEKLTGYARVVTRGRHEIHRYEFIRDAISMEDQFCSIEVAAYTMDGIRVKVKDIHIQYKLRERPSLWTTATPVDLDGTAFHGAIKNLSDNRLVSEHGLLSMDETVKGIVGGAIKRYINHHTIDQIITPEEGAVDARQAIKEVVYSNQVRDEMTNIGVRLLPGMQLGSFEFPDTPIDKFRLGRWRETRKGEIKVLEAESDAFQFSRQDAVRSRSQADMIRSILTALEDLNLQDARDLDALIQIRTAQILDMWGGLYEPKPREAPDLGNVLRFRKDEENGEDGIEGENG